MKNVYLIIICFLIQSYINAHPAIGFVFDGKQTIYYSDLNHVWKLDTRTGISEIYKENIHSHELFLDKEGNLYGEHYWYLESEEQFKNYIWRIDKDGTFQKIREEQEGENKDFSFIRDDDFNSYGIYRILENFQIIKADSISQDTWHITNLEEPNWQYLTEEKSLLFVDFPKIYRANKNNISVIAEDASARRFPFNLQDDKHNIYGLWTDRNDNIFIAVYGGRQIKKIEKNGKIRRVFISDFLWSPVNGVFDQNGDLWLMECRVGGAVRVRKIDKTELENEVSFIVENCFIAGVLILLVLPLIVRRLNKERNRK